MSETNLTYWKLFLKWSRAHMPKVPADVAYCREWNPDDVAAKCVAFHMLHATKGKYWYLDN